ncbi:hypothetical protein BKA67DRAFT_577662 [Truncatella angustata]|uniref:Uncharacterized protein n=1 Tax=Truncatella angustata TaxID=152316 RepID=A0A9P8RQE7_9PEZI|nr:uncharacterized protein BKA67DRAFT_577662 [Truncatella angustata]KAH6647502.1 hypothetical protein BKA67DRAFT_577662 [Truncatella angustata]
MNRTGEVHRCACGQTFVDGVGNGHRLLAQHETFVRSCFQAVLVEVALRKGSSIVFP